MYSPFLFMKQDTSYVFFTARDTSFESENMPRIGVGILDGAGKVQIFSKPIFYPSPEYDFDNQGVEEPRLFKDSSGKFWMMYNAYGSNGRRICMASSADLRSWTRHGPVLKNEDSPWPLSGSVVCEQRGNDLIAKNIDGSFYMYAGTKMVNLYASSDLMQWEPVRSKTGKEYIAFGPRVRAFDESWVSPAYLPLWSEEGILLLYNAGNEKGDLMAGQAVFASNDPRRLIARRPKPLMWKKDAEFIIHGLARDNAQHQVYLSSKKGHLFLASLR